MNKLEYIKFWLKNAKDDLETAEFLLEKKKLLQALFFIHLSIEKLLKCIWIKNNQENIPPKIHNLFYFIDILKIELETQYLDLLVVLNKYQIEGRYPEFINELYKTTTTEDTTFILTQSKKLFLCLQKKI